MVRLSLRDGTRVFTPRAERLTRWTDGLYAVERTPVYVKERYKPPVFRGLSYAQERYGVFRGVPGGFRYDEDSRQI